MKAEAPKVCAVVLNLSGPGVMEDCLRSLDAAAYPALEVIVVHNCPVVREWEEKERSFCRKLSRVIFTGANLGFAAGNNAGIKEALAAGADYVLLLNDDAFAAPDFLGPLVDALESDKTAGLAGPRIFYAAEPGKVWFSGAKLDRAACRFEFSGADKEGQALPAGPVETDYVTGCAVLAGRRLLESVGPLDERFFLYWEDSDWGFRAAAAGWRSLVVPASKAWHKVSVSSGGEGSPLKLYHWTRGRLLFAGRHAAAGLPRLLAGCLRDAAWLAFKSGRPGGIKKAAALLAGALSYFTGSRGIGPAWLRQDHGK